MYRTFFIANDRFNGAADNSITVHLHRFKSLIIQMNIYFLLKISKRKATSFPKWDNDLKCYVFKNKLMLVSALTL